MRWVCPTCGTPIESGSAFCEGCGSPAVEPGGAGAGSHVGRILGNRFRIDSFIAEGGMGRVYLGLDLFVGRQVAIKVLRPEYLRRQELRSRFILEGHSLFNVAHPNIVQFLAFWEDSNGEPYLVMEFLTGRTLANLIAMQGPLEPEREIVPICCQALDGLHHLHSLPSPLIHRDIKPDNIWLRPDGTAKIMDLGIAKDVAVKGMTQAGQPIGTLEYMSPEQVQSRLLTSASDQYSLGVTLFHMACGTVPFRQTSETGIEVMTAHVQEPPPDPREFVPELPEFLATAILTSLAKNPEDRFESCFAMKQHLLSCEGRA